MSQTARKVELGLAQQEADKPKLIGAGVGFDRVRRITGYLVGTVDRFNNAKRSELHDRIKHFTGAV